MLINLVTVTEIIIKNPEAAKSQIESADLTPEQKAEFISIFNSLTMAYLKVSFSFYNSLTRLDISIFCKVAPSFSPFAINIKSIKRILSL